MNIFLPDTLRDFIENEVAIGGYSTTSEYLRELLREAQKRKAQEKLEALLLEGLNSGPGVEVTPEWWQQLSGELLEHHQKTKSA